MLMGGFVLCVFCAVLSGAILLYREHILAPRLRARQVENGEVSSVELEVRECEEVVGDSDIAIVLEGDEQAYSDGEL